MLKTQLRNRSGLPARPCPAPGLGPALGLRLLGEQQAADGPPTVTRADPESRHAPGSRRERGDKRGAGFSPQNKRRWGGVPKVTVLPGGGRGAGVPGPGVLGSPRGHGQDLCSRLPGESAGRAGARVLPAEQRQCAPGAQATSLMPRPPTPLPHSGLGAGAARHWKAVVQCLSATECQSRGLSPGDAA